MSSEFQLTPDEMRLVASMASDIVREARRSQRREGFAGPPQHRDRDQRGRDQHRDQRHHDQPAAYTAPCSLAGRAAPVLR